MVAVEKENTSLLVGALGFSVLVHLVMLISVMNIEIPKATTRADFEEWVKDITPQKRKAIILPEVPKTVHPIKEETNEAPIEEAAKAAGSGKDGQVAGRAEKGSGPSDGSAKTATSARSKALRTSGILGLIGVASEGSSSKGSVGDVFSANSGKVSDDLGAVMEGKQRVELANSSNISRQALKAAAGGNSGPADIGGIASASLGKVQSGQRQESELPAPRVQASLGKTVSGNADSQSVLGVIARKNSSFTRCYERALRNNPDLAGKVGYELSVSEEGQVLDVRFVEDSLRSREVLDCIKAILSRLIFPAPKGGPAIFSSVLVFGTN